MITTVKAPESKTGKKYSSRFFKVGSFDAFVVLEEREEQNRRREYCKEILGYAVENCLTPAQRQAVELYYFRGGTMREIAAELGVNTSTLSRRLSAARRRLYTFANDAAQVEKLTRILRVED